MRPLTYGIGPPGSAPILHQVAVPRALAFAVQDEHLFDTVGAWDSTTRRCRGRSSNASSRPTRSRVVRATHFPGDGSDSPAWGASANPTKRPRSLRRAGSTPYAELHCHTNFSFLDGASHAEELVEEAVRLGLEALAITDHDGFYGIVRFAEAARALGLPTIFGAELTLGRTTHPAGDPDPGEPGPGSGRETHLVVLARDPRGYALLARAISEAQLRGEKGLPRLASPSWVPSAAWVRSAIAGTGSC